MSMTALEVRLRDAVRSIGGHMDVWAVFEDAELLRAVVAALADALEPLRVSKIVAVESRGFLLGGAVAAQLGWVSLPFASQGLSFPGRRRPC